MRTFVCAPPKDNLPNSDELKSQARERLSALWEVLNMQDLPKDISTEDLFIKANMTQPVLEKSLSLLSNKTTIILKRSPQACWVNQYNLALLQGWNANMDIQYVIDAYSCIKYILSYISKKESEEGNILKCAQQEAREGKSDALSELRQLGHTYTQRN